MSHMAGENLLWRLLEAVGCISVSICAWVIVLSIQLAIGLGKGIILVWILRWLLLSITVAAKLWRCIIVSQLLALQRLRHPDLVPRKLIKLLYIVICLHLLFIGELKDAAWLADDLDIWVLVWVIFLVGQWRFHCGQSLRRTILHWQFLGRLVDRFTVRCIGNISLVRYLTALQLLLRWIYFFIAHFFFLDNNSVWLLLCIRLYLIELGLQICGWVGEAEGFAGRLQLLRLNAFYWRFHCQHFTDRKPGCLLQLSNFIHIFCHTIICELITSLKNCILKLDLAPTLVHWGLTVLHDGLHSQTMLLGRHWVAGDVGGSVNFGKLVEV